MNILFLNTSDQQGGAAIAAKRIAAALNKEHMKVVTLVRDKTSNDFDVLPIRQTPKLTYNFVFERLKIWINNFFSRKNLFAVSLANKGSRITQLPEFKNADIIHLHWINQGFISLKELKRIIDSGKPIVWTMHDMWPITGICHHARTCTKYTFECKSCPFIRNKYVVKDLSYKVFHQKMHIYQSSMSPINFVGCSQWLTQKAIDSALTENQNMLNIPNPINTDLFQPLSKEACREHFDLPKNMKLILFGAAKTTNKRKGIDYFINACLELRQTSSEPIGIVLYGSDSDQLKNSFTLPTYSLGYIRSEKDIIQLYNAVDLFALPSLEENLPNSIMEAMACGVPCVGFNIGGIPELIDHLHNGYIAKYKSSTDLAQGLRWVLESNKDSSLSQEARRKVLDSFSEKIVAKQYINLYNNILK